MKLDIVSSLCAALALLISIVSAEYGHKRHHHHLHHHHHNRLEPTSKAESGQSPNLELRVLGVEKRGGLCAFPDDPDLVAVTPGSANAGWAMSPDQTCTPNTWCPYACVPGKLMNQWDPLATTYSVGLSMHGGLYCDANGNMQSERPGPLCVDGTGTLVAVDYTGSGVAFCQTVLPGNENMLIPTWVNGRATLAVPTPSYYASTAAHYFINPPGVSTANGCCWGSPANPWGNWAPYVAGGNTDDQGNTFMKLAWNPIYIDSGSPFMDTMPTWGVKIECDPPGVCNECSIDPSRDSVNQMQGGQANGGASGAGGANFCVVTVPKGATGSYIVFDSYGGSSVVASPSGVSGALPSPAATTSSAPSGSAGPSSAFTPASPANATGSAAALSVYPTAAYSPHILLENNTAPTSMGASGAAARTSSSTVATQSPLPSATAGAGDRLHVTIGFGLSIMAAIMTFAL